MGSCGVDADPTTVKQLRYILNAEDPVDSWDAYSREPSLQMTCRIVTQFFSNAARGIRGKCFDFNTVMTKLGLADAFACLRFRGPVK